MFKRKTLFVVGAGASAEFKLPLGGELASAISKKMDIRFEADSQIGTGDMDIFNQIKQDLQHNGHESQKAAWLIRDGILLSRSIDDFLDLHRSNPLIVKYGKFAIVKSILEAERASRLYFDGEGGVDRFSPERFADTWLVKFLKMLAPGIAKENVAEIFNDISFIVFNYDRCIEYFLLHALQKLYGISESKAGEILRGLDIEHPYGVIDPSIPFGAPRAAYSELAASVKTYTEQIADDRMIAALAGKVQSAEHIVFLGFAYHEQNMEFLKPATLMAASKRLFGTAYGMSDSDVDVVGHQIDAWFEHLDARGYRSSMIKIENKLKCAALFDSYTKSLTGD